MLCACRPVGINSYLKAERISMSKSIQVACECWEREIRSLQAISFTNQVVFSLRPEKDAYGVRAILPRPEGRGLSRFLVNLWPLVGVAVIIVGFILRFNPMLIVAAAAIITGLAAHFPIDRILTAIGTGFLKTRNIPLILLLPLAVLGLLERHGLRERAQIWISGIKAATVGRLLIVYLLIRELTAAVGLAGLGGHPQMARPRLRP